MPLSASLGDGNNISSHCLGGRIMVYMWALICLRGKTLKVGGKNFQEENVYFNVFFCKRRKMQGVSPFVGE